MDVRVYHGVLYDLVQISASSSTINDISHIHTTQLCSQQGLPYVADDP